MRNSIVDFINLFIHIRPNSIKKFEIVHMTNRNKRKKWDLKEKLLSLQKINFLDTF